MQFRVPKYLERESTIAFGLTFKKLAILGGIALALFLFYYIVPKIIFAFLVLIFGGAFFLFNFIKIRGESAFSIVSHSFGFLFSKRTFFWQKKYGVQPIKVVKKKKEEDKKQTLLKISPRSRLSDIRSKIDLGET